MLTLGICALLFEEIFAARAVQGDFSSLLEGCNVFDIHCHILPDVDDGARSFSETREMLHAAKSLGIDTIMCTPHCRWESFDKNRIEQAFRKVQPFAQSMGITMHLGYEVNWKKLLEIGIDQAPRLALGETGLFLLELSNEAMPTNWQQLIYKVQSKGLQVIIAHPERYRDIQRSLDIAFKLKEMGCYLQLSSNFITGGAFDARKRTASALLHEDLVDYVASDAHRAGDYKTYAQALAFSRKTR